MKKIYQDKKLIKFSQLALLEIINIVLKGNRKLCKWKFEYAQRNKDYYIK